MVLPPSHLVSPYSDNTNCITSFISLELVLNNKLNPSAKEVYSMTNCIWTSQNNSLFIAVKFLNSHIFFFKLYHVNRLPEHFNGSSDHTKQLQNRPQYSWNTANIVFPTIGMWHNGIISTQAHDFLMFPVLKLSCHIPVLMINLL